MVSLCESDKKEETAEAVSSFFWLGSGPTFGIDIRLIAGVSGIVGDIVPAVFASALALVTLVIRAAAEARGYGKDNERENK